MATKRFASHTESEINRRLCYSGSSQGIRVHIPCLCSIFPEPSAHVIRDLHSGYGFIFPVCVEGMDREGTLSHLAPSPKISLLIC